MKICGFKEGSSASKLGLVQGQRIFVDLSQDAAQVKALTNEQRLDFAINKARNAVIGQDKCIKIYDSEGQEVILNNAVSQASLYAREGILDNFGVDKLLQNLEAEQKGKDHLFPPSHRPSVVKQREPLTENGLKLKT